ncbi:IclR family transcriptional regulator [Seohaeicola zhoushanensis]|uniref:Transcriptional regulator n=1 Tax=Seohaeicola zhoushanensis TaxID=1569283 RepID=A0A8J3H1N9_9RHOB|nr:IclR family transcriptional regulator [Seohaeicola zhoushanensis]GHF65081.1 transcriptional regulator [Seohaeicola zhoushanensis]
MAKKTTSDDSPLGRYFNVLEAVVANRNGISLTEVARITGLPKPTAHRLLNALAEISVLQYDDHGRKSFQAGPRLWRILQLGANPSQVARYAQMVCRELSEVLGETCYCVRYDGETVESIAQEVSPAGYRFHVVPGDILPFHAAATAKVILAAQPDDIVEQHLSGALASFTPHTKSSRIDIFAELSEVRKNGFAICDREIDENVMAYAVPVKLDGQPVVYAMGVTGPVSRMKQDDAMKFIEPLRRGAERFAEMMSGRGPL